MTEEEYQAAYNEGLAAGSIEERTKIIRALVSNPSLVSECSHTNESGVVIFMPGKFIAILDGTPDPTVREEPSI